MSDAQKYIHEDKISLRELLQRGKSLMNYLLSKWKTVLLYLVIGGLLGFLYTLRRPTYVAETTFSLEEANPMGQLSGLTSSIADLGIGSALGSGNGLFQGENILELYRSKRMLIETLLTDVKTDRGEERLFNLFSAELEWTDKWRNIPWLKDISFDIEPAQFTARHDSILLEAVEVLQKKVVSVSKPSRRLNIVSVKVSFKDPVFARHFNEELVKRVNNFYYESKTRKTRETVNVFQQQADSLKEVLSLSLENMATSLEQMPNPNALYLSRRVPIQQKQMDIQSSYTAYAEIIKNLELAKLSHLEKQPLILTIDKPLHYLDNNKWKWYKGVVIGMFLAGVLATAGYTLAFMFRSALQEEESLNS